MACKSYPDWIKNRGFIDNNGIERYWFDCGEFFYDGLFNVVKFPKEMNVYHGSANLVNANVYGPYGREYYDDNIALTKKERDILKNPKTSEEELEKVENSIYKPVISWYGDYNVAKKYSSNPVMINGNEFKCEDKCIFAFKLIKSATFIILNDPMNINILLVQNYLTFDEKIILLESQVLGSAVSIDNINYIKKYGFLQFIENYIHDVSSKPSPEYDINRSYNPQLRYQSLKLKRTTSRGKPGSEYILPYALDKLFSDKYAGYVNPITPYVYKNGLATGKERFGELVFFTNVKKYLERDFENSLDWQHNDNKLITSLQILLNDFGRYKTFNFGFHSGNLLEHSIWCAFYAYYMFDKRNAMHKWISGIPKKLRDFVTLSSLIHDIGKSGDDKLTYYDKPEHSETGYDYIIHDNYKINGHIYAVDDLLKDIFNEKIKYPKLLISLIIKYHYEFGNVMKSLSINSNDEDYINGAQMYLNTVLPLVKNLSNKLIDLYVRMLIAVSIADVLAAQPFKASNPTGQNLKIEFYGNILGNVPKIYRGTNVYQKYNYDTVGYKLRSFILDELQLNVSSTY